MKRRVVLSPRAEQHVAAIYDYIFEQSGELRADTVVGRLLDACHGLDTFPLRGTLRDDIREGFLAFDCCRPPPFRLPSHACGRTSRRLTASRREFEAVRRFRADAG